MKSGFSSLAIKTALAITLASLGGCGFFDDGKADFDAVRAEALQKASPWDGYTLLVEAKWEGLVQCTPSCSDDRYAVLESGDKEMASLFAKSLDAGDLRAYHDLFSDPAYKSKRTSWVSYSYSMQEQSFRGYFRQRYMTQFLSIAESAADTSANQKLFFNAGNVLAKGQDVVFDYSRAINLLHRAWQVGSPDAALTASKASQQNNDPLNAYLWALRCIGACKRTEPLERFAKGLSPDQIRSAQQAATVRAVIVLGDSA